MNEMTRQPVLQTKSWKHVLYSQGSNVGSHNYIQNNVSAAFQLLYIQYVQSLYICRQHDLLHRVLRSSCVKAFKRESCEWDVTTVLADCLLLPSSPDYSVHMYNFWAETYLWEFNWQIRNNLFILSVINSPSTHKKIWVGVCSPH